MKNKRFFLCRETLATVAVEVPDRTRMFGTPEYEVTLRDCSRQIHFLFPVTRAGLAKANKLAKFFTELAIDLDERLREKKR